MSVLVIYQSTSILIICTLGRHASIDCIEKIHGCPFGDQTLLLHFQLSSPQKLSAGVYWVEWTLHSINGPFLRPLRKNVLSTSFFLLLESPVTCFAVPRFLFPLLFKIFEHVAYAGDARSEPSIVACQRLRPGGSYLNLCGDQPPTDHAAIKCRRVVAYKAKPLSSDSFLQRSLNLSLRDRLPAPRCPV